MAKSVSNPKGILIFEIIDTFFIDFVEQRFIWAISDHSTMFFKSKYEHYIDFKVLEGIIEPN